MASEFEKPLQKLISGGYKTGADKIRNLIDQLVSKGEIPNSLPKRIHPTLSLEFAKEVNESVGAKLADNLPIIKLMTRRMDEDTISWLNFLNSLSDQDVSRINAGIRPLAKQAVYRTVGELRLAEVDNLSKIKGIGKKKAEFLLAMFKKQEIES